MWLNSKGRPDFLNPSTKLSAPAGCRCGCPLFLGTQRFRETLDRRNKGRLNRLGTGTVAFHIVFPNSLEDLRYLTVGKQKSAHLDQEQGVSFGSGF